MEHGLAKQHFNFFEDAKKWVHSWLTSKMCRFSDIILFFIEVKIIFENFNTISIYSRNYVILSNLLVFNTSSPKILSFF